jgi:hypothetical protein
MGIVHRRSRTIEVDGQKYLWKLTGSLRHVGESYPTPVLTVGIEGPFRGQILQCQLTCKNECHDSLFKASVTPGDVEKVIKEALCVGWLPQVKNPPIFKFFNPLELKDYCIK